MLLAPFSGVQSAFYWSSTTFAGDTGIAWGVFMLNGFVDGDEGIIHRDLKPSNVLVSAVEAGEIGEGIFVFSKGEDRIQTALTALLMEFARRADEG